MQTETVPVSPTRSSDEFAYDPPVEICGNRRRHLFILAASCGVVLMTFLLHVRSDDRVEFRFSPGTPLPQTCGMRSLFGVGCPACGLTRSLIYLSRNDWAASLSEHRLGWLVALVVLIQVPYRAAAIRRGRDFSWSGHVGTACGLTLLLLLIANWLLGFLQ